MTTAERRGCNLLNRWDGPWWHVADDGFGSLIDVPREPFAFVVGRWIWEGLDE